MKRKSILLLMVLSLVVGGLTACAALSDTSANRGKIGDPVGTPLDIDLSRTPAAKGRIGDPVGTPAATPGEANPVGNSFSSVGSP